MFAYPSVTRSVHAERKEINMEPLSAVVGKKAIDIACDGAIAAIERAKTGDKEDVHAMLEYMEAARIAIWGLGQEREQILSDAARCDLRDPQCVQDLEGRIDKYLRTNRLRPELERAIAGLSECRQLMRQRSQKIMNWPLWGRADRSAALDEVSNLLDELIMFLNSLGNRLEQLNPSGVGAVELLKVEAALRQCELDLEGARLHLNEAWTEARNHGSNREWLDITLKVEGIGIRLRSAFR
jgi:hypothetical protein